MTLLKLTVLCKHSLLSLSVFISISTSIVQLLFEDFSVSVMPEVVAVLASLCALIPAPPVFMRSVNIEVSILFVAKENPRVPLRALCLAWLDGTELISLLSVGEDLAVCCLYASAVCRRLMLGKS